MADTVRNAEAAAELGRRHNTDRVIPARMTSTGLHVVCGQLQCGTRLAEVSELADGRRYVLISVMEGFSPVGAAGITWTMSARALGRLRKGEKPRWRRFRELPVLKHTNDVMDSYDRDLPTAVVCYSCGLVNLIGTRTIGRPAMLSLIPRNVSW